MVKLVVGPSNIKTKKYKAVFTYDDKKTRYRDRHKKDLDTKDYTRAGYLSYYILWGKNTNFKEAVKDYKKKFNLS